MAKLKVIQFQVVANTSGGSTELYVLLDDGSIHWCEPHFLSETRPWQPIELPDCADPTVRRKVIEKWIPEIELREDPEYSGTL